MIDLLLERIPDARMLAPLLGFAAGAVLSLSPVALPSVPVVMSALAPGQLDDEGRRHAPRLLPAVPAVTAFVAGMDGVLGIVGLAVVEVAEFLTRAAVVLHLLAAGLLFVLGLRLVLRRTSLCNQARRLPPRPSDAFMFGVVFAATGCPACGPIALGVGAAAALVGGPLLAFAVVGAFVAGRAVVLLAAAGVGARLLPTDTAAVPWRRLDVVVGVLFLVAAGYYAYRVGSGAVTTKLPGEPGGTLP